MVLLFMDWKDFVWLLIVRTLDNLSTGLKDLLLIYKILKHGIIVYEFKRLCVITDCANIG